MIWDFRREKTRKWLYSSTTRRQEEPERILTTRLCMTPCAVLMQDPTELVFSSGGKPIYGTCLSYVAIP